MGMPAWIAATVLVAIVVPTTAAVDVTCSAVAPVTACARDIVFPASGVGHFTASVPVTPGDAGFTVAFYALPEAGDAVVEPELVCVTSHATGCDGPFTSGPGATLRVVMTRADAQDLTGWGWSWHT